MALIQRSTIFKSSFSFWNTLRCNPFNARNLQIEIYRPDSFRSGNTQSYDEVDSFYTAKTVKFLHHCSVSFRPKANENLYMFVDESDNVKFSTDLQSQERQFEMAVFSCTLKDIENKKLPQGKDVCAFYDPPTKTYLSWKKNTNSFVGVKKNETILKYRPSKISTNKIFPVDKDKNIFFFYTEILDNEYYAVESIFANMEVNHGSDINTNMSENFEESRDSLCNELCKESLIFYTLNYEDSNSCSSNSDEDITADSGGNKDQAIFLRWSYMSFQPANISSYLYIDTSGEVKCSTNGHESKCVFKKLTFRCRKPNNSEGTDVYAFYHPESDSFLSLHSDNTYRGVKREERSLLRPCECVPNETAISTRQQKDIIFYYSRVFDDGEGAIQCVFAKSLGPGPVWCLNQNSNGSVLLARTFSRLDLMNEESQTDFDPKENPGVKFRIHSLNRSLSC